MRSPKNLFRFSFLVILLVVAVGCGVRPPAHCSRIDVERIPPDNKVGNLQSYGGPYEYDGGYEKVSNFGVYYIYDLLYSKSVEISTMKFLESVKWYCEHTSAYPYSEDFQRYNYVVDHEGSILVAIWAKEFNFIEIHKSGFCVNQGPGVFTSRMIPGAMINFYPESTNNGQGQVSPCNLIAPPANRPNSKYPGFLDAMSKHFFIAQDLSIQSVEGIRSYDPEQWTKTEVEYAGEIIVNVRACTYSINNGSGTYKPDPPANYLPLVANLFAQVLGIRPAKLLDYQGVELPYDLKQELTDYEEVFC